MVWHSMVRPAGEMELFNLTDFTVSSLCKEGKKGFQKKQNKAIQHH
jgi:hypothetical protein